MKKLSKAQQAVMDQAKKDIDDARKMEYPEWLESHSSIRKDCLEKYVAEGYLKDSWEERKTGVVLTHCNSKTLVKLEEMGLIEIIRDSNGDTYGIDIVKVLNY